MLETGIELSSVADSQHLVTDGIDGRGWLMVIVAMCLIGVFTLRPVPGPLQPRRIDPTQAEAWMADALPGIGPKTRGTMLQRIHTGALESLPARAQVVAQEVFTWSPRLPNSTTARPAR